MTTFIDYRYAKTLSTAMLGGQQREDISLPLSPGRANYLALEFGTETSLRRGVPFGIVAELVDDNAAVQMRVSLEEDLSIQITGLSGCVLLRSEPETVTRGEQTVVGFQFTPQQLGLKTAAQRVVQKQDRKSELHLAQEIIVHEEAGVRVLGRGSGRAACWAELYFNRQTPSNRCVEIVTDWHHLRSGLPLSGTYISENLIEHTDYKLCFSSYVFRESDAKETDFAKLFAADDEPELTLHVVPPVQSKPNPKTINLGCFVCESMNVAPAAVRHCNKMDEIIAISRFSADAFKKSGVRCPLTVIPLGVDAEYYHPENRKNCIPGEFDFNFLCVSTHVDRKNVRYVVQAFLEEFPDRLDVGLFLILRPEYQTTQNNVCLDFTDWENIHIQNGTRMNLSTGYFTRDNLRDFFASADAYVMPSNEGFGMTLLEAMACQTPVIGLNFGGVTQFLTDDNSYLISPDRPFVSDNPDLVAYVGDRFYAPNVGELRQAMRSVVEDRPLAARKAQQGRRDAVMRFTWERTAREIAGVIERLFANSRSSIPASPTHKPAKDSLSWTLCVRDDELVSNEYRQLRSLQEDDSDILCLFTRYARLKEIQRARKSGFLYYRWNGQLDNAVIATRAIVSSNWFGVLYPGESIKGSLSDLKDFLKNQPEHIASVAVETAGGIEATRFWRTCTSAKRDECASYLDLLIK